MAAGVPKWMFVLTDLAGNVLGEIQNASNRQVALPLNRVPTCTFQIPIQHPLSQYLLVPTWDGIVKAYRTSPGGTPQLRFCGPVVSSAEQFDASNGQTVAVNAAGAAWRLSYRLLGTTPSGWSLGNASTTYDLGYIAQQMLAAANGAGYTGIDTGTDTPSSNGSAGTYWFKDVLTALGELSTASNSFEFEVAPVEPTNVGQAWPRIGLLNTVPLIGTTKPDAVFEYGTTKANVASYGRQIDRTNMATKGYIQQPAVSDYSGVLTSVDAAAETARGRFEALIDDGGVQWDVLRQALVDGNIAIRKQARQVVTFQPAMNVSPAPFDDYIVGDQVRCRINVNSVNVLDAMLRIWGITFSIDPQGNETPQLELVAP